jgi:hypothetical protein
VGLVATWGEERNWKKIEKSLPKEYQWEGEGAKREKKREELPGES